MTTEPYESRINGAGKPHVRGPGNGLGYHSHALYPQLNCRDSDEAERAAKIANIAYEEGYNTAQQDMRKSMGVER
ncbi:MAG: hypothetical protein KAV87_41165 [Desulfobacteraceae bacterium]|nr:hypothetical protein [Desulfobacteraceae bacterium]